MSKSRYSSRTRQIFPESPATYTYAADALDASNRKTLRNLTWNTTLALEAAGWPDALSFSRMSSDHVIPQDKTSALPATFTRRQTEFGTEYDCNVKANTAHATIDAIEYTLWQPERPGFIATEWAIAVQGLSRALWPMEQHTPYIENDRRLAPTAVVNAVAAVFADIRTERTGSRLTNNTLTHFQINEGEPVRYHEMVRAQQGNQEQQ